VRDERKPPVSNTVEFYDPLERDETMAR